MMTDTSKDIYAELVIELGDPIVRPHVDRSYEALIKEAVGRLTIERAGDKQADQPEPGSLEEVKAALDEVADAAMLTPGMADLKLIITETIEGEPSTEKEE